MVDECEFDIMDCDHESRLNDCDLYCPQCGEDCEELVEGYCQECTDQNYKNLNEFEAQKRWWNSLPDEEKDRQIQNQLRFTC